MTSPLRPWRRPGRLFRLLGYILTALPVAIITFTVVITLLAISAGLVITFFLALPVAWLLFVASRGLGHVERSRIDALLNEQIGDPVPPLVARGALRRLWERITTPARWKEIGHHLARLPVAVLGFALAMAAWGGALALALLPAYVDELPGNSST